MKLSADTVNVCWEWFIYWYLDKNVIIDRVANTPGNEENCYVEIVNNVYLYMVGTLCNTYRCFWNFD